ncbi:hypothetical protein SAMN05216456_1285 [Devosia crocina]|uniref:Uncharacterized protein n=1 Tax=Devosia crocina TaxID=429728 RepID=A0A1I7N9N3_9HYPH|nr:hypothetical protein [Devosia crocina]SFV31266.1 hypothetical protein SAMN05216456_1285 [Devosia crocina]
MFGNQGEGKFRRLATQIAGVLPEDHDEALATLAAAEAVLDAMGMGDKRDAAKRIVAMTPEDPEEALLVLQLVREFLEYSTDRTRMRMHSLKRASGFRVNDNLDTERT